MTKRTRGTRQESSGTRDAEGVLVITGMHRSGTSLVASLLERGGFDLGEKLLAADKGNPRGYFEDVDFYEFHREALGNRRQHLSVAEDFVFEPSASERSRAEAIVAKRRHRERWGWKDPRTALFLDFWNEQLPDARFLFLFRHPLDVLLSLVRRGDVNCMGLTEGLDAWSRYNERILE
ncbi:MAG: sulfotransferase, partial [Vicinamibacteria bacterium]